MNWLKSKTMIVVACFVFVVGLQAYGLVSVRSALNDRITSLEEENAEADERVADLSSNLDVVAEKVDVTEQELLDAQDMAKQLRRENVQLRRAINAKADSKSVLDF